jgi:hypothetical protein
VGRVRRCGLARPSVGRAIELPKLPVANATGMRPSWGRRTLPSGPISSFCPNMATRTVDPRPGEDLTPGELDEISNLSSQSRGAKVGEHQSHNGKGHKTASGKGRTPQQAQGGAQPQSLERLLMLNRQKAHYEGVGPGDVATYLKGIGERFPGYRAAVAAKVGEKHAGGRLTEMEKLQIIRYLQDSHSLVVTGSTPLPLRFLGEARPAWEEVVQARRQAVAGKSEAKPPQNSSPPPPPAQPVQVQSSGAPSPPGAPDANSGGTRPAPIQGAVPHQNQDPSPAGSGSVSGSDVASDDGLTLTGGASTSCGGTGEEGALDAPSSSDAPPAPKRRERAVDSMEPLPGPDADEPPELAADQGPPRITDLSSLVPETWSLSHSHGGDCGLHVLEVMGQAGAEAGFDPPTARGWAWLSHALSALVALLACSYHTKALGVTAGLIVALVSWAARKWSHRVFTSPTPADMIACAARSGVHHVIIARAKGRVFL